MDVKIEKLVYGGQGLGHFEGQTVFVPFVLPEEVVRVQPVERKKKFVRARIEQITTPSPARVAPACRHFGVCGGCHYQHIPYEAQLEYKAQILRETLRRIGRVEWSGPIAAHAFPPLGYRNRAQWKIRAGPENGRPKAGYFQAASSTLCPVSECPVLSPRLAETLAALGRMLEAGQGPTWLQEVEAFADAADDRVLLNASLDSFEGKAAEIAAAFHELHSGIESVLLLETKRERMHLAGPGFLHYEAGGHRYRVGHLSFFQVNRFSVAELLRVVLGESAGKLALDLYAGVGFFAVPLAERFESVIALESNPAAARDLQANLEPCGARAQHVQNDVESFLAGWTEAPDLVVLDPPRAGVSPKALARLVQLAPQQVTYLSCDPATLGRDLASFIGTRESPGPYEIREMHLFDVFPQTYHIESLVVLRRRE
jgi:23S rRNA (uracil1939-C5)-methyltransferase